MRACASADDLERMTKKDGAPLKLRPVSLEASGVGYDEDGTIAGSNGLTISALSPAGAKARSDRASMAGAGSAKVVPVTQSELTVAAPTNSVASASNPHDALSAV